MASAFLVIDPGGTKYFLGLSDQSRERDPDDLTRVLGWYAELVIHPSGQRIETSYFRDGSQLYLQELRWGFDAVSSPEPGMLMPLDSPKYSAHLDYPDDRFDPVVSFRSGYEIRTRKRLQQVRVFSFGTLVRAYHVRYADEPPGPGAPRPAEPFSLSRVAGIEMRGVNDVGRLPPISFDYARPGPESQTEMTGIDGWVLNQRGVSFEDVDGDGMPDLLRLEAGNHEWKKNLGGKFTPARPLKGASEIDLESSRLMDLDGDARADLVRIVDDTWRWYKLVGDTWQPQGEWAGTTGVPLAAADTVLVTSTAMGAPT